MLKKKKTGLRKLGKERDESLKKRGAIQSRKPFLAVGGSFNDLRVGTRGV